MKKKYRYCDNPDCTELATHRETIKINEIPIVIFLCDRHYDEMLKNREKGIESSLRPGGKIFDIVKEK